MTNTATSTTSKTSSTGPVDPDLFGPSVQAALDAFAHDVTYAVAMARAAVTITRKRAVWQARRDIRAAEARARTECGTVEAFDCHAQAPCGVGDCKFADAELSRLDVPHTDGGTARPQRRSTGPYNLDAAVAALAQTRAPHR